MRNLLGFLITTGLTLVLIVYIGSKRKKSSRYERTPHATTDWQKLDNGIDPTK
ncbi:MAG: hypothetical protein ACKN92_01990 [Candidatus Nanopelagicaceae bacterium]